MAFVAIGSAALFLGAGRSVKGIWSATIQLTSANTSAVIVVGPPLRSVGAALLSRWDAGCPAPPAQSVRAELLHPAPTLGMTWASSARSMRCRIFALGSITTTARTASQVSVLAGSPPPSWARTSARSPGPSKAVHTIHIAGYGVIVKCLYYRPQPSPTRLLSMPASPKPSFQLLELG